MRLAQLGARIIVFPLGLSYRRPIEIIWLTIAILALFFIAAMSLRAVVAVVLADRFMAVFTYFSLPIGYGSNDGAPPCA